MARHTVGMESVTVMFRLDATTLHALQSQARLEGADIGDIVRGAIERDLYRRKRAKKAVRTDERRVAPLRALLAKDFAEATTWQDLQNRLKYKGFRLQEAGAGLALFHIKTNTRMAKASDLGASYSRLMRFFNAPFPGHSHRYLFARDVRA